MHFLRKSCSDKGEISWRTSTNFHILLGKTRDDMLQFFILAKKSETKKQIQEIIAGSKYNVKWVIEIPYKNFNLDSKRDDMGQSVKLAKKNGDRG